MGKYPVFVFFGGLGNHPRPLRTYAVRIRLIACLLLGIIFGVVLTKSEVLSWFRIQEMFRFQSPRMYEIIMNTAFRLFPDSPSAKGMKGRAEMQQAPTSEQVAFASLMRGVHW